MVGVRLEGSWEVAAAAAAGELSEKEEVEERGEAPL